MINIAIVSNSKSGKRAGASNINATKSVVAPKKATPASALSSSFLVSAKNSYKAKTRAAIAIIINRNLVSGVRGKKYGRTIEAIKIGSAMSAVKLFSFNVYQQTIISCQ
jgi:hypothetical protein